MALLTILGSRQLVATGGNGFRAFELFSPPFDLRVIATGCDRSALSEEGPLVKLSLLVHLPLLLPDGCSALSWRWSHTVSMGAVPASQFHKGPSGGQSQAGACRDRGGRGGARRGLEGFVAGEHVPGGDQDLARDRGFGGVVVARAAADVEVELVPGV